MIQWTFVQMSNVAHGPLVSIWYINKKKWIKLFYNQIISCDIKNGVVLNISLLRMSAGWDFIYLMYTCIHLFQKYLVFYDKNIDIKGITIDGDKYKYHNTHMIFLLI